MPPRVNKSLNVTSSAPAGERMPKAFRDAPPPPAAHHAAAASAAVRNAPPPSPPIKTAPGIKVVHTVAVATTTTNAAHSKTHTHSRANSYDLIEEEHHRDEKRKAKANDGIIQSNAATDLFYDTCYDFINSQLVSFRALGSGNIELLDSTAKMIKAFGALGKIPIIGAVFSLLSVAGHALYEKVVVDRMKKANRVLKSITSSDQLMKKLITKLSLCYAKNLNELDNNGIEKAAEFAAKLILKKLLFESEDLIFVKDHPEALYRKLFNAVAHQPLDIGFFNLNQSVSTHGKLNWKMHDMFWRGVVMRAEVVGVKTTKLFRGRIRKDPEKGCCDRDEYLRFARDDEEFDELHSLDTSLPHAVAEKSRHDRHEIKVDGRHRRHRYQLTQVGFGVTPLVHAAFEQNFQVKRSNSQIHLNAAASAMPAANAPLAAAAPIKQPLRRGSFSIVSGRVAPSAPPKEAFVSESKRPEAAPVPPAAAGKLARPNTAAERDRAASTPIGNGARAVDFRSAMVATSGAVLGKAPAASGNASASAPRRASISVQPALPGRVKVQTLISGTSGADSKVLPPPRRPSLSSGLALTAAAAAGSPPPVSNGLVSDRIGRFSSPPSAHQHKRSGSVGAPIKAAPAFTLAAATHVSARSLQPPVPPPVRAASSNTNAVAHRPVVLDARRKTMVQPSGGLADRSLESHSAYKRFAGKQAVLA